jgi:hypothetical protein
MLLKDKIAANERGRKGIGVFPTNITLVSRPLVK